MKPAATIPASTLSASTTTASTIPASTHLPEATARRVLLVQAYDGSPADDPLWTAEDRAWATRAAREEVPAGADAARFLAQRAHHALQRLAPRDGGVRRALARSGWQPGWVLLALALGAVCGLAVDAIGASQRINLLAPPVWGVIAWNLLVYAALLVPVFTRSSGLGLAKRWLGQRLAGAAFFNASGNTSGRASAMARFRSAWLQVAAPLLAARAALLLHLAAAALALGLMASLYIHGLVLDYRAGWQSTFLDAEQVRSALATLLAPAVATTGIAVPDAATLQALRVAGDSAPAASALNSAAPWIHLYAVMLLLFAVLPRTLLALLAAARGGYLAHRLPLPLQAPYFQRLLREHSAAAPQVQVLPHGAAPTPHARACLQTVLAAALGQGLVLQMAAATAYGDEEQAAALPPPPGTTLRLALLDLAATPEDDTHGAFVHALRRAAPGLPLLVLCDESAFGARFASMPERLAQRRAAWAAWARTVPVAWVGVALAQPDMAAAQAAIDTALNAAVSEPA